MSFVSAAEARASVSANALEYNTFQMPDWSMKLQAATLKVKEEQGENDVPGYLFTGKRDELPHRYEVTLWLPRAVNVLPTVSGTFKIFYPDEETPALQNQDGRLTCRNQGDRFSLQPDGTAQRIVWYLSKK